MISAAFCTQAGTRKATSLLRLKVKLVGMVILGIAVATVFAENNNSSKANENAPGATGAVAGTAAPAAAIDAVNLTALVNALLKKGVLTSSEVDALRLAAPESELQLLVEVLIHKSVLNAADLSAAAVPAGSFVPAPKPQAAPVPRPELAGTKPAAAVPAVVPLRALAFDPPLSGGLVGLKVGPVTFTPYGFIKATAEHDSSSPNGDDFPTPAGLMLLPGSNTGPNADPEFHM